MNWTALSVFIVLFSAVAVLGFLAARWHSAGLDHLEEWGLAGRRFGTLVTVDRPAKKGDFVSIDLTATIGGEQVDAASNISYELGSGELIDGIDDALETLTAGEETTFEAPLLGGDHEGESAQIEVKVLSVKEPSTSCRLEL